MTDEEDAKKPVQPSGARTGTDVQQPATNQNPQQQQQQPGTIPSPPNIPPLAPGAIPNVMALQLGVGMQQQQNPEVMRYLTDFLSRDSDNKLRGMESTGKRNHQFRMTTLWIGTGLIVLVIVVPMLFELYRGNLAFVEKFLTDYIPILGTIILALFAGAKVSELLRG